MAKLQGHFLKNRYSSTKAMETYQSLLNVEEKTQEMTIDEWLDRMNLSKYLPMFSRNQCYLVTDIKQQLRHGKFNDNFKFKDALDDMRINIMIDRNCALAVLETHLDHGFIEAGSNAFLGIEDQVMEHVLFKSKEHAENSLKNKFFTKNEKHVLLFYKAFGDQKQA